MSVVPSHFRTIVTTYFIFGLFFVALSWTYSIFNIFLALYIFFGGIFIFTLKCPKCNHSYMMNSRRNYLNIKYECLNCGYNGELR